MNTFEVSLFLSKQRKALKKPTILPASRQILFQQIWQERTIVVVDEEKYRSLYFDNNMTQSRMVLDNPLSLPLPYTQHILASLLFNENPQRILMFGLGGGSLAKFFLHYFPQCRMETIDSNPETPNIAQQFFFLPTDSRLHIHCTNGETFITSKQNIEPDYDLILVDAFDHNGMSSSVYDRSFLLSLKRLLSDFGVMAINTSRSESHIYQRVLAIVTDCFPNQAFRLPVQNSHNEIIFCCNQGKPWKNKVTCQKLAWINHPDLDFVALKQRMIPLKQPFWRKLAGYLTGHTATENTILS